MNQGKEFQEQSQSSAALVETKIIDICQYAIVPNQIVGLLPLKCSEKPNAKGKLSTCSLEFKIFSAPFLSAISILSVFFVLCYLFNLWLSNDNFAESFAPSGASDFANYTVMASGLVFTANVIIQRIRAICTPKANLVFWKAMLRILTRISESNQVFRIGTDSDVKHSKVFVEIKRKIRNSFLIYSSFFSSIIVEILVYSFGSSGSDISDSQSQLTTQWYGTDFVFFFVTSSWSWYTLMHWLIFLWLSLPLRLCEGCLKIIAAELNYAIESTRACGFPSVQELLYDNKKVLLKLHEITDLYQPANCRDQFDETLRKSIRNFYEVQSIVQLYQSSFGRRLVLDVLSSTAVSLGSIYMGINAKDEGSLFECAISCVGALAALHAAYDLGSTATDMETECNSVMDALCRFPLHFVSKPVRTEAKLLVTKFSNNPLSVNPGSFFTLQTRLIVSILSLIMTSLIVLVQFRDSGCK